MTELRRTTIDGACNDPQPHNWGNACQLRPGHVGEHRFRKTWSRGWDLVWQDGTTRDARSLGEREYVR